MTTPETLAETSSSAEPQKRATSLSADDFEVLVQKLKLLEFGLYGLQQYGRNAPLDAEDIGPFCRLAEEIESDLLELQRRTMSCERRDPS